MILFSIQKQNFARLSIVIVIVIVGIGLVIARAFETIDVKGMQE